MTAEIHTRDFSITEGEKVILTDLTFDLESGQSLALYGPGGSGKSLFMKYLFGSKEAHLDYGFTAFTNVYQAIYYVDCNDGQVTVKSETPQSQCDLFLIDEPEKWQDLSHFQTFHQQLKMLNKTLVFVTHRLDYLRLFADQIAIVKHGSYTRVLSTKDFFNSSDPYISYLSTMGC